MCIHGQRGGAVSHSPIKRPALKASRDADRDARPDVPKRTIMLPTQQPLNGDAGASTSRTGHSLAKAAVRPSWSLWPLQTSPGILSSPTAPGRRRSAQSIRDTSIYPASSSPSPPSPFGPGHQSDSSPPATPPDCAGLDVYAGGARSNFRLDATRQDGRQQAPSALSPSPSPSSRNNIFSSPVVSPVPAPRFQTGVEQMPKVKGALSRNASFFDSPITQAASSPQRPTSRSSHGHRRYGSLESISDRPSYGRSSTEERERERARIRQSNAEVDFRLCPVKDYLLGTGRHCTVYLGAYRKKGGVRSDNEAASAAWNLCAIKRLYADRQSQLLGLEEAFALRRLGPHPNIVRLINIRDEVELSSLPATGESTRSGAALPIHARDEGENGQGALGKGYPSHLSVSAHGRSTSESLATESPTSTDTSHMHSTTHRRLASTPGKNPVVTIASPDGDEVFASPILPDTGSLGSDGGKASLDPPRLLILLELLPYSLSSFAKRNPDQIRLSLWLKWARELAGVVEWLHGKGCVHADLKPENVLLTADLTVKLCDFNSALFPHPSQPLTDGLGLGTPAYGAPELASSKGFSYPVDIWSLGAILYTLAVGMEPFQKARSMIDILYRKRFFFESEENDRVASLSVAMGSGASVNGGSATVSRNGSLRGKKRGPYDKASGTPISRPTAALQRENSSESVSSIASSVMLSGSSGRNPSIRAINMLLEPSLPIGLFVLSGGHVSVQPSGTSAVVNASASSSSVSNTGHGHQRAASLGKAQTSSLLSPTSALRHHAVTRPTVLRRTTSYSGADGIGESSDEASEGSSRRSSIVTPEQAPLPVEQTRSPTSRDSAGLRLAVTAAFAQSSRTAQQERNLRMRQLSCSSDDVSSNGSSGSIGRHGCDDDCDDDDDNVMLEDATPYFDGSPALLLPGGGRLPDAARDLLERMLNADADKRPTAAEVRQQLEAL